jgi:hypothetical protein
MLDLDCWIISSGAGHNNCLPDSREAFWRIVLALERGRESSVYVVSPPLSAG